MGDMQANESSFMLAANSAIIQLQSAIVKMQAAAQRSDKEAKHWKLITRVLGVVSVLALATACLATYNWFRGSEALNRLRDQTIASCMQGNAERSAEVQVWNRALDGFLNLNIQLVITSIAPVQQLEATTKFVRGTKKTLKVKLAPHDCAKAYNTGGY